MPKIYRAVRNLFMIEDKIPRCCMLFRFTTKDTKFRTKATKMSWCVPPALRKIALRNFRNAASSEGRQQKLMNFVLQIPKVFDSIGDAAGHLAFLL